MLFDQNASRLFIVVTKENNANTFPVTGTVEVCVTPKIAVPDGQDLVGFAYEIEARDEQGNLIVEDFNKSVRLIFYFDEDALPASANPEDLIPAFYSTARQEWTVLENVYLDPYDWFITGKIDHFSRIGVIKAESGGGENQIYLPLVFRNFEG